MLKHPNFMTVGKHYGRTFLSPLPRCTTEGVYSKSSTPWKQRKKFYKTNAPKKSVKSIFLFWTHVGVGRLKLKTFEPDHTSWGLSEVLLLFTGRNQTKGWARLKFLWGTYFAGDNQVLVCLDFFPYVGIVDHVIRQQCTQPVTRKCRHNRK